MKKLCFLFMMFFLYSTSNVSAQISGNNFDLQKYQVKLQKFVESLTPEERMMFAYSFSQSSRGNGLSSSTEDKIDKIYDILKGLESITCDSAYSGKLECKKRLGYY